MKNLGNITKDKWEEVLEAVCMDNEELEVLGYIIWDKGIPVLRYSPFTGELFMDEGEGKDFENALMELLAE